MDFSDKIILITGSSKGIGKDIALSFAKCGATIILNGHEDLEALEKTFEEIKIYNENSIMIFKDVSVYEDVLSMFKIIYSYFDHIDVLINNAGISNYDLITEINIDDWNNIINTNLNSVFYTTKIALQNMIQNKSGNIINISSIWGEHGSANEVAYSTSKGAVNSFTKAVAKEVGLSNIRVNAISCGMIDTNMNSILTEEEKKVFIYNHTMLNKIGEPNDVSNLVIYLASDYSKYITGQIINLDGGYN